MSMSREEARREDAERDQDDPPFDDGDVVRHRETRAVGVVTGMSWTAGYRARLDEPGEPQGWSFEVHWTAGETEWIDADYLDEHDEDED